MYIDNVISANYKYSLNVTSRLPEFQNKTLKKYNLNDFEAVGVYGNEPFSINFLNGTGNKVQVKVSLDGTDVLTGQEADLDSSKRMWVVQPHSYLTLSAWAESTNGGAEFIFTNANNSVAAHTHGNTSNQGVISVAVFEETYVAPRPSFRRESFGVLRSSMKGAEYKTLSADYPMSYNGDLSLGGLECFGIPEQKTTAAVGAGKYINQRINYTEGLVKPGFAGIVKLNYMWWSDLVAQLDRLDQSRSAHLYNASGFKGFNEKLADLGSSPRVGDRVRDSSTRLEDRYDRFGPMY